MKEVTIRFKAEADETVQALVDAWLASEPVTLALKDGRSAQFALTYVREREVD